MKQRLKDKDDFENASIVERFQNQIDRPYKQNFGAAALFCQSVISNEIIEASDSSGHPNSDNLFLVVIKSDNFMTLVNQLFNLAGDEA
jgi:hypothetical protein